jgi:hypothetical protein
MELGILQAPRRENVKENADDGLKRSIICMARAVQTFKRYKMSKSADTLEQPRKTWEDLFRSAKGVVLSLVGTSLPLSQWQCPTFQTIEDFLESKCETVITRSLVLQHLGQTKLTRTIDEDLFLVACIIVLLRAGQAEDVSLVKPNENIFDNTMKELLCSGSDGKADEYEPNASEALLLRLKSQAKAHLQPPLWKAEDGSWESNKDAFVSTDVASFGRDTRDERTTVKSWGMSRHFSTYHPDDHQDPGSLSSPLNSWDREQA